MRVLHPAQLLLALAICFPSAAARAQATALVDPLDPVYGDIRLLSGAGLIDDAVLGQQPFSRAEIAALLRQADRKLVQLNAAAAGDSAVRRGRRLSPSYVSFLESLVAEIRARLQIEPAGRESDSTAIQPLLEPIRGAGVDLTGADSPTRRVPPNNGLGTIDAVLNPLLDNRQGRPLVNGSNVILHSEHIFESSHVALSLEPELQVLTSSGQTTTRGVLQSGALRLLWHNAALDVGREYVRWGQGDDVGLLGSNNSPALNLLRLSNEQLLTLPWIFRYLGPSKFSIFYSKLGAEQNFPYPYFVGYKISITPSSNFELGGVVYSKSGGHGAPRGSFSARIIDLFPFLDASAFANKVGLGGVFEFSDRYAGMDARWRIPSLRDAEVYGELLMNDFDVRRMRSVLWQDAGHVFGVRMTRLSESARLGGSFEFHHTGDRYYEHAQFLSGQTSRRMLIGDQLGPDGRGAYATLNWYRSPSRRLSLLLATERRSNDQYAYWNVPLPKFGWSKVEERPKEWRERVMLSWDVLPQPGQFGIFAQAGYERAQNFDFVQGEDRNNALLRVGLNYRLP